MTDQVSIIADIGGTNTRVALSRGMNVDQSSILKFKNKDYDGLANILKNYLEKTGANPDSACAAIAGPVRDGVGRMTNLDWVIDRELLQTATGAKSTSVINDLQAQGHALGHLAAENVDTIHTGDEGNAHAARLVVGVGTGMNAAAVFRTDLETLVPPAEVGHTDLPTPTAELRAFADFMIARNGFCSNEELLSGRGLTDAYEFISREKIEASDVMARCAEDDPNAIKTIQLFCYGFGCVVGNLALSNLPFGGIYLIGGVSRAVAPYMQKHGFIDGFTSKGRFSEFMQQFPVRVVHDDFAALTGMAALLEEIAQRKAARS